MVPAMLRFSRTVGLGALLLAALAQATTLLALDVIALTHGSGVVVRGKVKSSEARWTRDGARIMTDTAIEVRETWKGAHADTVTVMQQGGVLGDVGQLVHGTVPFRVGDEVVLFLEARGTSRFMLTGMMQGVFRVQGDDARQALEGDALFLDATTRQPVQPPSLTLKLDALRAQVLAASGATAPTSPTSPVKVTP